MKGLKRIILFLIPGMLCVACATAEAPPPKGGIRFTCAAPQVLVYVNDHLAGECRQLAGDEGLKLPAGKYRVEARFDGYFTQYVLVDVSDAFSTVAIDPTPVPAEAIETP